MSRSSLAEGLLFKRLVGKKLGKWHKRFCRIDADTMCFEYYNLRHVTTVQLNPELPVLLGPFVDTTAAWVAYLKAWSQARTRNGQTVSQSEVDSIKEKAPRLARSLPNGLNLSVLCIPRSDKLEDGSIELGWDTLGGGEETRDYWVRVLEEMVQQQQEQQQQQEAE